MKWLSTVVLAVLMSWIPGNRAFAAAPEKGQTFPGPGVDIYYESLGTAAGVPLIVVNGGPGFDHTYLHISPVWEQLAKTRRIVMYDQRGTGRSSPVKAGEPCTLADQIADLEALRAHLGSRKISILGHSWGGLLGMAYAARYPDAVAHLILVDSAAPKWNETAFLFSELYPEGTARKAAGRFAEQLGDRAAEEASMREYLSMLFYSPEKRAEFLATFPLPDVNTYVNEALNADLERFDLNPELGKFRFPSLVITGRYDANVAPVTAWRIHQGIANSQFVAFEHSGHIPFYEEPEMFVKVVGQFLSEPKTPH